MAEGDRTVKAYVESVTDDPHSQQARLLVTFRLEWPSRVISPLLQGQRRLKLRRRG